MKKLDLNIKLGEVVKSEDGKRDLTGVEVALRWIGNMLERAINKPDPKTGRATLAVNMDVQRKYFKVMDTLEKHKDGIVEVEDDTFDFLNRKFHQAELPVFKGVAAILVSIENAINKAKVVEKEAK